MSKTTLYLAHGFMRQILLGIGVLGLAQAQAQEVMNSAPPRMLVNHLPAEAHIVLAIVTSGIFVAAFLLALTLGLQARRLHRMGGSPSLLDKLPPVLTLERLLFRVLNIGFVFLTVLMISGMVFGEVIWGHALLLNHKVVFTLMAWFVFAALLAGRYFYGWRGLSAVRATIFGFVLLFLAYVGTHFVLDVLLKRS
jgi:ABC-type uncharacterized transport system permease subunit